MVCYIVAMALQIAGAILLLINFLGDTKAKIYEQYYVGSNIAKRDDNNKVKLEADKIQKCVKTIYLNRVAIIYIIFGYILAVLGDIGDVSKWMIIAYIAVLLMAIIVFTQIIVKVLSKTFYKNDLIIDYEEVSDRADTELTNKEIDDIWSSVFDDTKKHD